MPAKKAGPPSVLGPPGAREARKGYFSLLLASPGPLDPRTLNTKALNNGFLQALMCYFSILGSLGGFWAILGGLWLDSGLFFGPLAADDTTLPWYVLARCLPPKRRAGLLYFGRGIPS